MKLISIKFEMALNFLLSTSNIKFNKNPSSWSRVKMCSRADTIRQANAGRAKKIHKKGKVDPVLN
jgi:hypothetical protein